MKFYTVTEFKAKCTAIVRAIEDTGKGVIITKNGKPVVYVQPVSEDEFLLKPKERGETWQKEKACINEGMSGGYDTPGWMERYGANPVIPSSTRSPRLC